MSVGPGAAGGAAAASVAAASEPLEAAGPARRSESLPARGGSAVGRARRRRGNRRRRRRRGRRGRLTGGGGADLFVGGEREIAESGRQRGHRLEIGAGGLRHRRILQQQQDAGERLGGRVVALLRIQRPRRREALAQHAGQRALAGLREERRQARWSLTGGQRPGRVDGGDAFDDELGFGGLAEREQGERAVPARWRARPRASSPPGAGASASPALRGSRRWCSRSRAVARESCTAAPAPVGMASSRRTTARRSTVTYLVKSVNARPVAPILTTTETRRSPSSGWRKTIS